MTSWASSQHPRKSREELDGFTGVVKETFNLLPGQRLQTGDPLASMRLH